MVIEELASAVGTEHKGSATKPATFEELFHAERTRLFGALCVLTGDRTEAEDLAQDAFVRVGRPGKRPEYESSPAWSAG